MKLTLTSKSSEATEKIAEQIGARLRGGEIIELIADLGGGKTTFMRGLVRGAKSKDAVSSPTFTVSKVYSAELFDIHHFDFYRVTKPGLIAHELEDLAGDPEVVVAIEWGDSVRHILPNDRLTIRLDPLSENERKVHLVGPAELSYLTEGV